jgi:broad specificity phosphatase PhoE
MIELNKLSGEGQLYFVRHGQSEGYERGLIKGRSDYPLSRGGIAQAETTAEWFSGNPIDAILSSPLKRALETAQIIASRIGTAATRPEVIIASELEELDTGLFTGLTLAEAAANYPHEYRRFEKQSWEGVPGAEKIASLIRRMSDYWQKLFQLVGEGKKRIISVTHKGVFQWIMHVPFGSEAWMPLFEIDFCGIYRLSFDTREHRGYFIWDILNFVAWE